MNEQLANLIDASNNILVFTGAGISTRSGIKDYRGPQGVWKTRQPVYYQDFMNSEEARIEYWDYKLEGWESFRDAKPNEVHFAIADLEKNNKLLMVVTQNIDGLHKLAGTTKEKLVEIHGTNSEIECQSCEKRTDPEPHFAAFKKTNVPPLCSCGGYLKPATISFGQNLNQYELSKAIKAATEADLVIALGSTLSVNPAAGIALIGAEKGAHYVIINKGATEHDGLPVVSLRLEGDVSEIFPEAVKKAFSKKGLDDNKIR